MRTTLTLDDDVVAQLKQAARSGKKSFKQLVNEALRAGLTAAAAKPRRRRTLTRSFDGGRPLVSLDSVAEALAVAEGEAFR